MSILILYNSFSGNGKGKLMAEKMKANLEALGLAFVAFENHWPPSLDGFDEVFLFGGDGTLNYFINHYGVPDQVVLTLFPGGTGNDLHWKLFDQTSVETQMQNWQQYPVTSIDVASCNNEYFVNMIGLGFDGEVLRKMKTVRLIGGHLGYLLVVIRLIFSFREKWMTLQWAGSQLRTQLLLCQVSNSSRTGGGFHVAPHAIINDGWLNLTFCEPKTIWQRLLFLPKVEKGKHLSETGVHTHTIQQLEISAEADVYYQLDGELRCRNHFTIDLAERKLRVRTTVLA